MAAHIGQRFSLAPAVAAPRCVARRGRATVLRGAAPNGAELAKRFVTSLHAAQYTLAVGLIIWALRITRNARKIRGATEQAERGWR